MNLSDSPASQDATPQATPIVPTRTIFSSSPVQLRAAAYLYGVETVPLANARVLELGCGAGDNLLPFAMGYPHADVVGVDGGEDDIAAAQATAKALGAVNATFHVMSALDLDPALGQFDYIILHEAYGKVPAELGQMLLAACRQFLSPTGVAFISYATQPGWKAAEVLRDAMLFAGHASTDIGENVAAARSTLTLMKDSIASGNPMGASLAPLVKYAMDLSDDELVAEFLEGDFAPGYFIEFANAAAQHGLLHLGDAEPEQEMPLAFGGNVAMFNSLTGLGQSAAFRQQNLDFAVGRTFRRSMLVHADRASECRPAPDMSRLSGLRFAGCFRMAGPSQISNQAGRTMATGDAGARSIMAALTAAWPASRTMQDLVREMNDHSYENEATVRDAVRASLELLFRSGMLRITREPSPYDLDTNDVLGLTSHLRHALSAHEGGGIQTWSLWHEPVTLDLGPTKARELAQFDGHTPVDQWLGAQARVMMPMFEGVRDRGLLTGSPKAWAAAFQELIQQADVNDPHWRAQFDSFYSSQRRHVGDGPTPLIPSPAAVTKSVGEIDALRMSGQIAEANTAALALVEAYPNAWGAWLALCKVEREDRRPADAARSLGKSLMLDPLGALPLTELAELHLAARNLDLAEVAAARAAVAEPNQASTFNRLALVLREKRMLKAALRCLEFAEKRFPNVANVHNSLGAVKGESGMHESAEASYRRGLELSPNDNMVHSNLLFQLTHRCAGGPAQLLREHQVYGTRVAKRARSLGRVRLKNDTNPDRALRVGFVSGDLRAHAVMNFLSPIWKSLDRSQFKIYAYHTVDIEDATSDSVRPLTEAWHRVSKWTDPQLRDRIVEDQIDILFDLSGHTNANRLAMFAMRAAPVQISWIGYPATTGVEEMDYFLNDLYVAKPGVLDDQFVEKLAYLPSIMTFSPHPQTPPVQAAPALRNRHITFGSFNRYNKISDEVLALWCRVLDRVPNSKMLLGNIPNHAMKEMTARFAVHGIDATRLMMRPNVDTPIYLAYHQEVDIMLDTFPYTGGTTTCHSLWMGVPVVSIEGPTRVERQTSGLLNVAGLENYIASTQEDFVEVAVARASDIPALAELRKGMRERLKNSVFLRSDVVTLGLEKAMREMWRIWAKGEPPRSFTVS